MANKTKRLNLGLIDCCPVCHNNIEAYVQHLKAHPEAARLRIITQYPRPEWDGLAATLRLMLCPNYPELGGCGKFLGHDGDCGPVTDKYGRTPEQVEFQALMDGDT